MHSPVARSSATSMVVVAVLLVTALVVALVVTATSVVAAVVVDVSVAADRCRAPRGHARHGHGCRGRVCSAHGRASRRPRPWPEPARGSPRPRPNSSHAKLTRGRLLPSPPTVKSTVAPALDRARQWPRLGLSLIAAAPVRPRPRPQNPSPSDPDPLGCLAHSLGAYVPVSKSGTPLRQTTTAKHGSCVMAHVDGRSCNLGC